MKNFSYFYVNGNHRWGVVSRDPEKPDSIIDTNEFIICKDDKALLTDPGGSEIFPEVFSAISKELNPNCIEAIFASHQDPDVISSLSLWLEMNSSIKCYVSWLWSTFLPHYGQTENCFITLKDEGEQIPLGTIKLDTIPAHYLHSPGNFNLYDSNAKILFSGDIGAALLPSDFKELYVKNFDDHIIYMEGFHKRWMPSNEAKNLWCERVSNLKIDILCPQHGAFFKGEDILRFINWFAELKVGSGNIPVK